MRAEHHAVGGHHRAEGKRVEQPHRAALPGVRPSACSSRRSRRRMLLVWRTASSPHNPAVAAISHAGAPVDDEADRRGHDSGDRRDRRLARHPRHDEPDRRHHGRDHRLQHGDDPGPGRHALAATQPARQREDVPEDRRGTEHVATGATAQPQPGERGQHALQRVEDEHERALAPAQRARHVGRAGVARAGGTDVDARGRRHQRRARERAEQVGRRGEHDPHRRSGQRRRNVTGREWSAAGRGADAATTPASASSPWPCTHSGSGPSRGRPVKNLAAMHPPWQAS